MESFERCEIDKVVPFDTGFANASMLGILFPRANMQLRGANARVIEAHRRTDAEEIAVRQRSFLSR